MLYKTICLELLQQQTQTYDQLLKNRTLLPTLEFYANRLRDSHLAWKDRLLAAKPGSSPDQISSEAMEMAIDELASCLPSGSPPTDSDPLSLDCAMAFLRLHTPPA